MTPEPDRSSCPGWSALSSFHTGHLPEEEIARIAVHLATCRAGETDLGTLRKQHGDRGVDARLRDLLKRDLPDLHATTQGIDPSDVTGPLASANNVQTDELIGPFRLSRLLGQGGMGVVYLAQHTVIGRPVALKMLRDRFLPPADHVERFRIEMQAIAKLQHPNIVPLIHADMHQRSMYFTMEYIDGCTLADRLKQERLSLAESVALVHTLACAMHYAHEQQVVHRDLKPANILLKNSQHPMISDFGLAKLLDQESHGTISGAVMGTPAYMAPEQASGKSASAFERADIYALGAILYHCVTGRPPFQSSDQLDVLHLVRTRMPTAPSLHETSVPPELDAICLKCLQKSPDKRYRTMAELAADLDRFQRRQPVQAMPSRLQRGLAVARHIAVPFALVLAVIVLSGGLYWSDPKRPLQNHLRRLDHNETTTLVGAGEPWYRLRSGEQGSKIVAHTDGTLSVLAWEAVTLVELLPKVPTSEYTLRAMVRHERSDPHGFVGLYVAHRHYPGTTPTGHNAYMGLTYNDIRHQREDRLAGLPDHLRNKVELPANNGIQFGFGGVGITNDGRLWEIFPSIDPTLTFAPNGLAGDRWRALRLDVYSDSVMAYWDDQPAGEKAASHFEDLWTRHCDEQQKRSPTDASVLGLATNYQPRGGLGLVLYRGSATFKDVTVTPRIFTSDD